jgi:ubiquinone/menaquinone biosynthesis C-methylase UbiE
MEARYSPQHPDEVRRQSFSQYESIWHGYADARRALYPYEVPPWESREPYNIWFDMADHLEPKVASKVIDIGTNDGYFHRILRDKGFQGEFIGIDIEGKDLPAVEHLANRRFPDFNVRFMQGDAQNLKNVIGTNSTSRAIAAFLTYHVPMPGRVLSEMHRILEPDGIGVISTRGVTNQLDTWQAAQLVAHNNGFAFPQELPSPGQFKKGVPIENISVYSHFGIKQSQDALYQSRKFKVLHEHIQDSDLWIKADESGFFDYSRVVESLLPYTRNISSGESPKEADLEAMRSFINQVISSYFFTSAEKTRQEYGLDEPYYKSHANQAFFVVQAVK